jgi:hypothetical protein
VISDRALVCGLLALLWLLLALWFVDHGRQNRRYRDQLDELIGPDDDSDETQTIDVVEEPPRDLSVGRPRRARRGRAADRRQVHAGGS